MMARKTRRDEYNAYDHKLDAEIAQLETRLIALRRKRRGKTINAHGWLWCNGCGGERVHQSRPCETLCSNCEGRLLIALEAMFAASCWGCCERFGAHLDDCAAGKDRAAVAALETGET